MKTPAAILPLLFFGLASYSQGTLVFQSIDITGGTATQSTTGYGWTPDRAINGNYSDGSHTDDSLEPVNGGPWWNVDFGTDNTFSQVTLYNRGGFEERLSDITVEVLNGGAPVYTSPVLNPNNSLGGPARITVDLGGDYTGNALKVSRDPNSTIGGQGVLTLMEVEIGRIADVMLASGTNLTHSDIQAMTVAQSTDLGATYAALNGVDGNYGNFTHTASADASAWWEVDFGEVMRLESMTMFNRTSCCGERLRDITVTVLDASGNTVFTSAMLNPNNDLGFSGGGGQIDYDFDGNPVLGQTVRISRTADPTGGTGTDDAHVLSLAEVDIIGASAVPEPSALIFGLLSGLALLARRRRVLTA